MSTIVKQIRGACLPHVIGLPVLVDDPELHRGVAGQIGGEFEADHAVDGHALDL